MVTTQQAIIQLMQERGIDPSSVRISQFRDFAGPALQAYREAQPVERSGIPTNDLRDALNSFIMQSEETGETVPDNEQAEEPQTTPAPMPVETQPLPPQANMNQAPVSTQGAVRVAPGVQGQPQPQQNATGAVERPLQERVSDLDEAIMRELSGNARPVDSGGPDAISEDGNGIPFIPIVPYAPGAGRSPQGAASTDVVPANPEVTRATMTGVHPQAQAQPSNVIDVDPRTGALPSPMQQLPPPSPPAASSGPQQGPSAPPRPSGPVSPVDANVQQSMEPAMPSQPSQAAQQPDRPATVDDLVNMQGPTGPTTTLATGQPGDAPRVFGSGNDIQVIEPNGQPYAGRVQATTSKDGSVRYVTDDGRVFDNAGRFIGQVGTSLQQILRNIRGAL